MNTTFMRSILLIVWLLPAIFLHAQNNRLDLYLQPDLQSDIVETVESNDPRLGPGSPVPDEVSAAIGWHFADFTGTINGFIPDAKVGKDLYPVDNAIIYSGASSDSTVIATYHTGDELEIVDTGAWWEVRLTTTFPVYFLKGPAEVMPPASPMAGADVPMMESPGTPASGSSIVLTESPPPQISDQTTRQSYQGVFKKSKKGLGLFTPKAPFYLEDSSGNRLAWIDTKSLIASENLERYLDKEVLVHGEREFDSAKKEWIIHARNMRLQ